MSKQAVTVIGAGLAGVEAAWQLAIRGVAVKLYEMRPQKQTPVHQTGFFAELVCSNSLRAAALQNAVGLLKEEMRLLDSLIIQCADETKVPAGGALAVDRNAFADLVTKKLSEHPLITIDRTEQEHIPEEGIIIISTGPLTSAAMADAIGRFTGEEYIYFYDAVAPIVTYESLNMEKIFRSNRYNKGEAAYLNCPLSKEEYENFWQALTNAAKAPRHEFEREKYFEGCMPVEAMAARGQETLLYGPLKPVGLTDPATGRRPYAVVQLRQDDLAGTLFNLVGFQTSLQWDEQKRVFRLIPGLEEADFVRLGVMHRNTFINSPAILLPTLQAKKKPSVFFAGQITGVEGYVESAACGLIAGINAALLANDKKPVVFPPESAHGSLISYITTADPAHFQPMNITFGLFPKLSKPIKIKKERNCAIAEKALASIMALKKGHPHVQ